MQLLKEKAELQEKLRAERKEHANVRVAMAASGSLQSPARPGPSGHATTLSPTTGRVHSADIDLAAIVGGGKPLGAVNGGGATVAGKAAARTPQAAADPSLRMMPANAHDIAMPAHVDFPEPKAGGQCAPCVVQ
ncbi:50S ribosomal protein L29 [archaeon]|nr:MAG: 50S ribosomal protein L29 [archaeon]